MMQLTREIRFSLGPPLEGEITNSWAGWPAATGIQPYLTLRAVVAGEPDPITGYLCNIKLIDHVLRERAIPLAGRLASDPPLTGERLVMALGRELYDHAPAGTHWVRWELKLTPYLRYTLHAGEPTMVRMTQSFEFAAAHRLHCPTLSDEENRRTFGKCNHVNGHGHNYQVEITLEGQPDAQNGVLLPVQELERIVDERVIHRFDHKHLNADCAEFADVNPSVENITRVIWNLLEGRFGAARLANVRVYETPKTCADYAGD